jgi:Transposase DDE domain
LQQLPRHTLLVADAGYVGFQLAQRMVQDKVNFLLRMCSNVTLYRKGRVALERYREGVVWYWPSQKDANAGMMPLRLRLIRIRAKRRENDVWLLTNVMEHRRLPLDLAGQFYRWRWQKEGCFRTYKQTLKKVKLVSRSLRLVHREAEGSWLALQLLLAQGVLAQKHRAQKEKASRQAATAKTAAKPQRKPDSALMSPRQIIIAIRQEMSGHRKRGAPRYGERLRQARGEHRPGRTSPKTSREWPRPKQHKPPMPPKLLTMTRAQKSTLAMLTGKAA